MTTCYRLRLVVLGCLLCLFSACAALDDAQQVVEAPAPRETPAAISTARPSAPPESPRTPTLTPLLEPVSFRVGQDVASEQAALEHVRLELRRAILANDQLELQIVFINTSDTTFSVTGIVPGRDARLVDAHGNEYAPRDASSDLNQVNPPGGFAPGGSHSGTIIFPRPRGPAPYEFLMPAYAPIHFRFEEAESDSVIASIPNGEYSLGTTLRSAEEALVPIALEVRSVAVLTDTVTFDLVFTNMRRQGYRVRGVDGNDAWLLDADGTQYRPISMTDTLATSITPGDGWRPGGAHQATITFPRPGALQSARFIFASYSALTIHFDATGVVEARITSPTGATPMPLPTTALTETVYIELTRLLDAQASGLLASDPQAYMATFTAAQAGEQTTILERRQQVPLAAYELELVPSVDLAAAASNVLQDVAVEVRYAFAGIPGDSRFFGTLRYDFERVDGVWRVAGVRPGETAPFWLTGDVSLSETEHFMIFTRPDIAAELPVLEQEAEDAYARLRERGLPLETRYVAYFSATAEDFQQLTGRTAGVVGVAFWHYQVHGDAIAVLSRSFYVNGAAFSDRSDPVAVAGRRATIAHELVHLALAGVTRPFTPAWLKEGVAVYFEEQDTTAVRQQMVNTGMLDTLSLPTLTQAGSLLNHAAQSEHMGYAYAFSGAAVDYLVQTFGEDKLLDFYRSYTEVPVTDAWNVPSIPAGTASEMDGGVADFSLTRTDDALQRFFGLNLDQLDAAVKAWLTSGAGG